MRKLKLLFACLLMAVLSIGQSWADTETYTFTSKSWAATNSASQEANWTSGKDGGQLTANQGIQVTTGVTGANGTSPVSFDNVSSVVVRYCTNASKGAGTIKVKVGSGTEKSFTVTKPSSGGTTLKDATFDFDPTETGNIKVTVECTTNSIYIYSVTITYTPAGGGSGDNIVKTLKSIEVSGMTTTYDQNAAFSFDGTCTATYSVTKNDVAQEDEQKEVTPTSVSAPDMTTTGEKTITVSYTENEVTKTTTYNITVNEHTVTPGEYSITPNNTFFNTTATGSITGTAASLTYTGTQNDITVTYAKGSQSNMYINASQTRAYNGSVMTFSVPAGYVITAIAFTADGSNWAGDHTVDVGTMTDNKNWAGSAEMVTVTFKGTCRIAGITVTYDVAGAAPACTAPTITTQPIGATYTQNDAATALSVEAEACDKISGTLSYQWYSNETESNEGGVAVTGEEVATFTPSTAAVGVVYYYCVVSQGEASVASEAVAVTVEGPEVGVSFEQEASAYTDWTFANMESQHTGDITAHTKTYYGTTGGKATASMVTANKIAAPGTLSFFVSKQTNNTTASTWYVKVSSDGTDWTEVTSQSATSMSKGEWVEVNADLSTYTNVYIGIFYEGSTAVRNIDDVILTTRVLAVSAVTYDDSPANGLLSIENNNVEIASGATVTEGDVLDIILAGNDGYVGSVAVTATESGDDITAEVYNAETGKLTMPAYSITVTATFVVGVETPVFDLADGIYADAQLVVLTTSTTGATIYYTMTTDGSTPADPTNASTLYDANEGIELNARGTYKIKAVAYKNENYSTIASAEYTLNIPYVFATVAELMTYLDANSLTELENVVVTGVVSNIVTAYSSQHNNVTFDMSDDGQTTGNQLRGYRTAGTNADVVAVGDKVTLSGDYTLYNDINNNTLIPELKVGNTITAYTAKVLSSVTVGGNATKTVYSANETFDFDGLTATAYYSNTGYSALIDDAEITWATNLSENKVTESATVQVTATYGGISSATYNVAVTVSTKDLSSIALGQNAYTVYKGAALPKPAVTATYTEGEPADVSAEAVYDTENAYDAATADVYTITVSYTFGTTTKTATYQVTVQEYANADDAPYTVAQALDIIVNAIGNVESADEIVVSGTVSEDNINNNKNRYKISDGTNELLVYGGKGFNNATFTNANYPKAGDVVVVKGKVIHYQGNTPEFATGKSYLLSQIRPVMLSVDNVTAFEVGTADLAQADLTIDTESNGVITLVSENENVVTIVDGKLHAVAPGTVNVTANMAATNNVNALNYAATSTTFQVTVIADQTRYAVTFAANGGEGNAPVMEDQLEGATFDLPANTYTYAGHKFAGWNDGTTTYAAGAEYTMPAADVEFTAQWTEIPYYAGVYTSNVPFAWTGESGENNSKVVINSTEYNAQKVGSSSKTGSVTVTVPYGTHTLHFHALAWNGKSVTITASGVNNMNVSSFALTADGGFSGSTTYDLQNDPTDQYFVMTFDATTEVETTITFSYDENASNDKRFLMYGINQEGGVERALDHIEIGGSASQTTYEDGDLFNPAGLTISAVYNIGEPEDITNDVTWSFNPSILTEGTTSVTATATYGEQTDDINVPVTVTASTHAYTTREVVFVVKSGDDYFAMGQDNTGSYLNAVPVEDVFNGKIVNMPVADRAAITWILREYPNGETAIMTQNGKFLNGAASGTNLTLSDTEVMWTWDGENGCYNEVESPTTRTFLYQAGTVNKFRFYNKSSINVTPYSSAPMLLTEYVDGTIEVLRDGLTAGKIGTVCWNKQLVEVEGAVLYEPEYKVEDNKGVGFIEVTTTEAGKPYVFQAEGETIRGLVVGDAVAVAGTNNGLHGTFTDNTTVPESNGYIFYENKIRPASNNYVNANRAYLVMDEVVDQRVGGGDAPARRRLVIGRPMDTPTELDTLTANDKATKVLMNGQIYIIRDGKWFDVTGQEVKTIR